MHKKKPRNGRFPLYRSAYVRKGKNNNTHGYPIQKFVGSIPVDAQAIPPKLDVKLTDEERRYVERESIEPARRQAEAEQLKREAHERDPNWRLVEAARLLREARDLADAGSGLDAAGGTGAVDVLEQVQAFVRPSRQDGQTNHPLQDALKAIHRATRSVKEGRYGRAPAENVRSTDEYQLWASIKGAVDGDGHDSLLRAMQDAGFAKAKGR